MVYALESVDNFLSNIETKIIDILYDYKLLSKFTPDVKKVIMHTFIHEFFDVISDNAVVLYHSKNLSNNHELLNYFEKDKLDVFINKICIKLRKITKKIIFLKKPLDSFNRTTLENLDGSVVDELLLLEYSDPINPKDLSEFLDKHSLKDMFQTISKRIY